MTTLDFPTAPTVGQTYSVAGSPTYTWDGEKWAVAGGGVLLAANNLSDVASAPISFRNLGGIDTSAVVSISGAVALTASAFGRLHLITGTAAAYTVTLPTPVGNSGALIALMVGNAAAASVLYTVASPSGNVGRSTSLVMWAQECLVIRSNGTNWEVIDGRQIPFSGVLTRLTDQGLTPGTANKINMTAVQVGGSGAALCYDAGNTCFKAPRAGVFLCSTYAYVTQTGSPTYSQSFVCNLAAAQLSGVFSWTGTILAGTIYGTTLQNVVAGAQLSVGANGNGTTVTAAGASVAVRLDFSEVCPSW